MFNLSFDPCIKFRHFGLFVDLRLVLDLLVHELVWLGFVPKPKMFGFWFLEPNKVGFLGSGVDFGGFLVSWA